MGTDMWAFETDRLAAGGWHDTSFIDPGLSTLPELVTELLSASVTASLPEEWRGGYSIERAGDWISARDAEGLVLLAVLRDTRDPIGLVLLHESSAERSSSREVRLGYLIREPHWGQGYASEIVLGVVRQAQVAGSGTMLAGVARDNPASVRVLERCGFLRIEADVSAEEPQRELMFQRIL